jgi:hypothetical protein
MWDESFKEIWLLYSSLIDVSPFWKRRRLQTAWYAYKGVDPEGLREGKEQVYDAKRGPVNKNDFLAKIKAILALLRDKEFQV